MSWWAAAATAPAAPRGAQRTQRDTTSQTGPRPAREPSLTPFATVRKSPSRRMRRLPADRPRFGEDHLADLFAGPPGGSGELVASFRIGQRPARVVELDAFAGRSLAQQPRRGDPVECRNSEHHLSLGTANPSPLRQSRLRVGKVRHRRNTHHRVEHSATKRQHLGVGADEAALAAITDPASHPQHRNRHIDVDDPSTRSKPPDQFPSHQPGPRGRIQHIRSWPRREKPPGLRSLPPMNRAVVITQRSTVKPFRNPTQAADHPPSLPNPNTPRGRAIPAATMHPSASAASAAHVGTTGYRVYVQLGEHSTEVLASDLVAGLVYVPIGDGDQGCQLFDGRPGRRPGCTHGVRCSPRAESPARRQTLGPAVGTADPLDPPQSSRVRPPNPQASRAG